MRLPKEAPRGTTGVLQAPFALALAVRSGVDLKFHQRCVRPRREATTAMVVQTGRPRSNPKCRIAHSLAVMPPSTTNSDPVE
jgi:hypothetical protein